MQERAKIDQIGLFENSSYGPQTVVLLTREGCDNCAKARADMDASGLAYEEFICEPKTENGNVIGATAMSKTIPDKTMDIAQEVPAYPALLFRMAYGPAGQQRMRDIFIVGDELAQMIQKGYIDQIGERLCAYRAMLPISEQGCQGHRCSKYIVYSKDQVYVGDCSDRWMPSLTIEAAQANRDNARVLMAIHQTGQVQVQVLSQILNPPAPNPQDNVSEQVPAQG